MRVNKSLTAPVSEFEKLHLFLFPFRMSNILILLLFVALYGSAALLFWMHFALGMLRGVMVLYLATILFAHYVLMIVEYTSLGYQELPKVTYDMMLPTHDHRLLKQVLLILTLVSGYYGISNENWQYAYLCLVVIVFPLATSVISNERLFYKALNPLVWIRMLIRIGPGRHMLTYFALQIATMWTFYDFVMQFNEISAGEVLLRVTLILVLTMLMFRGLGIMIHDRADELGLRIVFSERLNQEAEEQYADAQFELFMAELHDLSTAGKFQEAWDKVKTRLKEDYYESDSMFFRRLQQLERSQLACRHGIDYMERLLARGEIIEAWRVFEWGSKHWRGEYAPSTGRALLTLAGSAGNRAQYELVAKQLEQFEQHYPNHPEKGRALLVAAWIYCNHLDDFERGKELLVEISRRHAKLTSEEQYKSLRRILRKA